MPSKAGFFRAVVLLSVGALAVHQLRFALGSGQGASEILSMPGHSYLPFTGALAAVALSAAVLCFARSLLLAHQGRPVDSNGLSFAYGWACSTVALVAVYALQEGFEGEFSPGRPSGLVAIFGNGGWIAIPLALAIGGLIALLLDGSRRAIIFVGSRARRRLPRPLKATWSHLPFGFPNLDALALSLGARAPPHLPE